MMVRAKIAQARVSDRPNRFKGALGMRIEKIMLAERRDAALDGFDATEHCPGVEVLRSKDLRRTIDPFEPRQEREDLPIRRAARPDKDACAH